MTWVVVHYITVTEVLPEALKSDQTEFPDGIQTEFPIDEDMILYNVSSAEELEAKIQEHIEIINGAGAEGIRYCGLDAKQYCVGVRKVMNISNDEPDVEDPVDETLLTYSFMTVKTLEDAQRLADGKAVMVNYIDDDSMEDEDENEAKDEIEPDEVIQACYELLTDSNFLSAMNSLLTLEKHQWLNVYDDWLINEPASFHEHLNKMLAHFSVGLDAFKNAYILRTALPKSNGPNYQMIFFLNEETLEQGSAIFNFGCLETELKELVNPIN